MPRILRILNRLNLGGPTYNAGYLTRYLPPPFETKLVAGSPETHETGSDYILASLGLEAQILPSLTRSIHPIKDLRGYLALQRVIREFKPDIVHTHASKAGTLGRLAAWREGVPLILHTFHGHWFHSYFSPAKTRILLEVERRLSAISTAVVAISPGQARDITEGYRVAPQEKVHVIPLGIDTDRFDQDQESQRASFRHRYGIPEEHVVLMHVGRLVPVKQQDLLLRVFAQVRERSSVPVTLFLVGDGPERQALEGLAQDLGLAFRTGPGQGTEPLVFTSWIRRIEEVHAGADIGILTSRNEGTPLSLIECQAAGRPVVSTRVGGVEDCVVHGETGYLASPEDPRGLASRVLELVEHSKQRTAMGARARAYAAERFSYRRLVEDTRVLYESLWESLGR